MILMDSPICSFTVCTSFGPDKEYFFPVEVYDDYVKGVYDCTFNGVCIGVPSYWFENSGDLCSLPDFDASGSLVNVYDSASFLCFQVDADEPLRDFVRQLAARDGWCMEAPY